LDPGAALLARLLKDALRWATGAWDASAGARRDASADECRERPHPGAGAEKSVDLAPAAPEPGAAAALRPEPSARAELALCTRAAALSAERSTETGAVPADAAAPQEPRAWPQSWHWTELGARLWRPLALRSEARLAQPSRPEDALPRVEQAAQAEARVWSPAQ